ncbi:MAG TPA: hypothetical protein VFQ66_05350 [Candidatus Limnocylindria bacterium]|nr:hypothetical protein [Candidatus Limnocylindria bacterium]
MEILLFVAGLIALDILALAVGPNTRDVEAGVRVERAPIRTDAYFTERPDTRDWR